MTVPQAIMSCATTASRAISSDRGPVTDARRYPVPDEGDANARVARRFRPYFDAIGDGDVTAAYVYPFPAELADCRAIGPRSSRRRPAPARRTCSSTWSSIG